MSSPQPSPRSILSPHSLTSSRDHSTHLTRTIPTNSFTHTHTVTPRRHHPAPPPPARCAPAQDPVQSRITDHRHHMRRLRLPRCSRPGRSSTASSTTPRWWQELRGARGMESGSGSRTDTYACSCRCMVCAQLQCRILQGSADAKNSPRAAQPPEERRQQARRRCA